MKSDNVPSIPWPIVNIKAGERYADGPEELVDTQEISMKSRKDYLRGVSLFRYK